MSEITKAFLRQLKGNHLHFKKIRKYSTRFIGFINDIEKYPILSESFKDYKWRYLKPEITNDMVRIIISPDVDIRNYLRKDFLKLLEKYGAKKAFKIYSR